MEILNFPELTGWPSVVAGLIVVAFYTCLQISSLLGKRNETAKKSTEVAHDIVREAQSAAMEAMREESQVLRRRIETLETQLTKHDKTISMIIDALKNEGLYVIVLEDKVTIRKNGTSKEA